MFTGIPIAALDFYEDLAADNSKAFWTAHKHVYDESVRAPIGALVAELEPDFGAAKVFRPYRDVRFAKDKTPYKTAQGAFVGTAPGLGYYLQIDAAGLYVGGGIHHADSEQIARFRAAVDHDVRGAELIALIDDLSAAGYTIGGEQLKTKPRGFDADHPRIDLLRHKSLTAGKAYPSPSWLDSPRTLKEVRKSWEAMRPLVEWISAVVA